MLPIKKKLLSLTVMILSTFMVFAACAKDVYKNLKLELSTQQITHILSDNEPDNTFDVEAKVTGRPNKYNGAVVFDITNPTGAIVFQSQTAVSGGNTTGTFRAVAPGQASVVVRTREGNLSKIVSVNIVREVSAIALSSSAYTMARGSQETISSLLVFTPSNTSQKAVTYSLSLPDESQVGASDLTKITITQDGQLTIPADTTISTFLLTATSVAKPELSVVLQVNVVEGISPSDIKVYYNNNTQSVTSDDVLLEKDGDSFVIELAKNVTEFSRKEVYFTFKNGAIDSDLFSITAKSGTTSAEVNPVPGLVNTFSINTLAEGTGLINFDIKQKGYEDNSNLTRRVSIRVKSVSYPKQIVLTNGQTPNEINSVTIYDNYQGRRGAPVLVTVRDDNSAMINQYVYARFNKTMGGKVRIESASGEVITETTPILTGSTVYVYHTYAAAETAANGLALIFESATHSVVQSQVSIAFVRGQINIGVENANLKIDKSANLGAGKEYGYVQAVLRGLVSGFDYSTLKVVVANPNVAKPIIEPGVLGFAGTGVTGDTTATITAPNGSSVVVNITVFEALVADNTKLILAGQVFSPVDPNITVAELSGLYHISLRNGLTLDLGFIVNGVTLSDLPNDITPFIQTLDLQGNTVISSSSVIRTLSYKRIQTQSIIGSSILTFGVTGYNTEGVKNQELTFKVIIDIKIPISEIKTTSTIVDIYDQNSLGASQINQYGSYSIKLQTLPVNTQFAFDDLQWRLEYGRDVYSASNVTEVANGDITYTFTIGGGSIPSYVALTTNRYNYATATVSARLSALAASSEKFNILAIINQSYGSETGEILDVRRELKVRFTVSKPKKVENIIFNNIHNNTVTFDARDLNYSDGSFKASDAERTAIVSFTTLPQDALTSSLAVVNTSGAISVVVDNDLKVIRITANTKISNGVPIELVVYPIDSQFSGGGYSKFVTIKVEILDGSNEQLAYKVKDATDLIKINNDMTAYYVLTNNINLNAISSWTPIGVRPGSGTPVPSLVKFNGSLNGSYEIAGKTHQYQINGLSYQNLSNEFRHNYIGLFGAIGVNGVVKNIEFNNVKMQVSDNSENQLNFVFVGAVAGLNEGVIENVLVNDGNNLHTESGQKAFFNRIQSINNPNTLESLSMLTYGIGYSSSANTSRLVAIGGIVGFNTKTLLNNYAYTTINFNDVAGVGVVYAGGVAGINFGQDANISKTIEQNYVSSSTAFDIVAAINIDNLLSVTNENSAIGGVAGFNSGQVQNQNVRTIVQKALHNVGGVVGKNATYSEDADTQGNSYVVNNLVVPTIRGVQYVGGLIGTSIEQSVVLKTGIKGSALNYEGLANHASYSAKVTITGNKVEFIDYKLSYSEFNTAIIADNYAGGLIGSYTSSAGMYGKFTNAILYNAVNSFYTNRTIENYYALEGSVTGLYFGDIVLRDVATTEQGVHAGGLIGYTTNAFIASNSFNGNIQGSSATIGGVVGYVEQTQGAKSVVIINTSVGGRIINSPNAENIEALSGAFFGDATNVLEDNLSGKVSTEMYENGKEFDYGVLKSSIANIQAADDSYVTSYAGKGGETLTNLNTYAVGQTNLVAYIAWQTERIYKIASDESDEIKNSGIQLYNYAKFNISELTEDMIQNGFETSVPYNIIEDKITYDDTPSFTLRVSNMYYYNDNATLTDFSKVSHAGFEDGQPPASTLVLDNTQGFIVYSTLELLDSALYNNSADVNSKNRDSDDNNNSDYYNDFQALGERNDYEKYTLQDPVAVTDQNDNGIGDDIDISVEEAIDEKGAGYLNVANISQSNIDYRINDVYDIIKGELAAKLGEYYWFSASELNNHNAVLFSRNQVLINVYVQDDVIKYDYRVLLLSNWPPTEIRVSVNPNYDTVYERPHINGNEVVITHTQISQSHYINSNQINLTGYGLTQQEQIEMHYTIVNALKQENTHEIDKVVNMRTIPGFIGIENIRIESDNNAVLTVEVKNGKPVLVTKGSGVVNLKFTSTTNPDVTHTVRVNVVAHISAFNVDTNTGLTLQKRQGNSVSTLNRVDQFDVVKTNENNIRTVSLQYQQANSFVFTHDLTGKIVFNTPVNNASGVRYYYLSDVAVSVGDKIVEYKSIWHGENGADIPLKINDGNFKSEQLSNGKYVYYIDADYSTGAVFSSDEISKLDLLAVPYVVTQDGQKVLLLEENKLDEYGIVSQKSGDEYSILNGFKYISQITVNVISGTWGLTTNISAASFEPIGDLAFDVKISTDNASEKLYVRYMSDDGQLLTYLVDDKKSGNDHGSREFKIGKISVYVSYKVVGTEKTYSFMLSISEADRFDTATLQTLGQEFEKHLEFMVLDSDALDFDKADDNRVTNLNITPEFSRTVRVKVIPQSVKNITLNHYPNGETEKVIEDNVEVTNVKLDERAFDTIIPGYAGILKVNVMPYFANFDYIVIEGIGGGQYPVSLEQMLAEYDSKHDVYTGKYKPVTPFAEVVGNGIKLTKQSFIDEVSGVISYDGFFYIRTIAPSTALSVPSYTITIKGYKNKAEVFEADKTLTVIIPPGLNLHHNGAKNAVAAVYTTVEFTAIKTGVTGNIDFMDSYRTKDGGNTKSKTGFEIRPVAGKADAYTLTVYDDIAMIGHEIYIVGYIEKEINGKMYKMQDTLVFKISNFVINNIIITNAEDGRFVGTYGQLYDLTIKIDATYNRSIPGIETEIRELERKLSTVNTISENFIWFEGIEEAKLNSLGYSKNNSYILSIGMFSGNYQGVMGLKMRNVVFNSPETLGATVDYVYGEKGIEIVNTNDAKARSSYKDSKYYCNRTATFTFALERNKDIAADPIRSVSELKEMQAGRSYILISDLVLENWVPLNTEIASLDGNGYVLTIKSFNLAPQTDDINQMVDVGNIGLFGTVSAKTTLKNITIEIVPSNTVELADEAGVIETDTNYARVDIDINAKGYKNVNFGFVAGINNGIITNTAVVYDASALRLERDLKLIASDPNNVELGFDAYMTSGEFKYANYLKDNFGKYFPWKIKPSAESDVWKNLYDTTTGVNYGLLQDSGNHRRDLSIARVLVNRLDSTQRYNIAGLVAQNSGYITNSSVENITIIGEGYVAGFVVQNNNKISSSFFKGANIINRSTSTLNALTAGLVVNNIGSIQYSYVLGREGDGNNFIYAYKDLVYEDDRYGDTVLNIDKSGKVLTPTNYADKTGLSADIKPKFAGTGYNSSAKDSDEYNPIYGALRALNSAILSNPQAAGFVYNNSGIVSNSYSNILVSTSSAGSSGFAFTNSKTITDVYSLSSVQVDHLAHSPFMGTDTDQRILNTGTISYANYLSASATLAGNDGSNIEYKEQYKVVNEIALPINFAEFSDYNTFQGYAFNSDYSENKEIERGVWFIPNGIELTNPKDTNETEPTTDEIDKIGTNEKIRTYFKHNVYLQGRPELVAANLRTLSVQKLVSTSNATNNEYNYVSNDILPGKSVRNPILIDTAEKFNQKVVEGIKNSDKTKTVTGDQTETIVEQQNAIRFISDIQFNNQDLRANTYTVDYVGDFDGNGMTIRSLRLIGDADIEVDGGDGDYIRRLGLFGSIRSSKLTGQRGIVRNINIEVSEVRGTNVVYVGVLAGIIEDAGIYNINITGSDIIQGKHVVGGLAGWITGESEIVNISVDGIGANASYYYQNQNPFSASNNKVSQANIGKFTMFNSQEVGNRVILNERNLSYVGGIAGILDVKAITDSETQNQDSNLRTARARKLKVSGDVNFVGEIVGGIFGGVNTGSVASDIEFEVSAGARLRATRVAGGLVGDLRGTIDRAYIRHTPTLQNTIDQSIKAQTPTLNNNITNSTLNHNNLFANGNPIYMGGIVGINYGGNIINTYGRVNVININAMYGGGIAGLNVGGSYEKVYTTATVSAFKVVGGVMGLQIQRNIVEKEYESSPNGDYRKINNNDYVYVGEGKGDYVLKSIKFVVAGDSASNGELYYIDIENAKLPKIESTTNLNGVIAANIWRKQDVDTTSRTSVYNAPELIIGAVAGNMIIANETNGKYLLSDAFKTDGASSVSNRQKGENTYFNQVLLGDAFGTKPVLEGQDKNIDKFMQEIGTVNGSPVLTANSADKDDTSSIAINSTTPDLRLININSKNTISYTGVTKNVSAKVNDTLENVYHVSRMQNLGSARTITEIINRIYMQPQATAMIDTTGVSEYDKVPDPGTDAEKKPVIPYIYNRWPVNFWKGTEITKSSESAGYILHDPNYVFPHVVPTADLAVVNVYTARDLLLMSTYRYATYILMNDIDLSKDTDLEQWAAPGTPDSPFRGKIISHSSGPYTIKNLLLTSNADTSYLGLVGYTEKSEFRDFNLTVSDISINNPDSPNDMVYVGAVYAHGDKVVVTDVHVSAATVFDKDGKEIKGPIANISADHVAGMGGIAGYSTNSVAGNVSVTNINITAKSLFANAGLVTNYVGGAFGLLEAASSNITLHNIAVNNVDITVNPVEGLVVEHMPIHFYAGGVFGSVEYKTGTNTVSLQGVTFNGKENGKNKLEVTVNTDSSSALDQVRIGGIAGNMSSIDFKQYTDNSGKTTVTHGNLVSNLDITVSTSNYSNAIAVGGAIGQFNSDAVEDDANAFNMADLEIVNSSVIYKQGVRGTGRDVSVGGVIGHASSIMSNNIKSTTAITVKSIESNSNMKNLYVGGFIGRSESDHGHTNIYINSNISTISTSGSPLFNATESIYYGGLIGKLEAITIAPGETGSDVNKTNNGAKNVAVEGDITVVVASATVALNVGGIYGEALGAYTNGVVSNMNLSAKGAAVINMGGIAGVASTSSDHSSEFKNTYSTGDLTTGGATVDTSGNGVGSLGGLVGKANITKDKTLAFDAVYSISKHHISSDSHISKVSNVNRGGILGAINAYVGYTKASSELIVVSAYYAAEGADVINDIGTPLSYADMLSSNNRTLFESKDTGNKGFKDRTAWDIAENVFPMLVLGGSILEPAQSKGREQNPISPPENNLSSLETNTAYVVTGSVNLSEKTLTNNTIYYKGKDSSSIALHSIDATSALILQPGSSSAAGTLNISTNNGKIYSNKSSVSIVLGSNHGVISGVTANLTVGIELTGLVSRATNLTIDYIQTGLISESIMVSGAGTIYNSYQIDKDDENKVYYYDAKGIKQTFNKIAGTDLTSSSADIIESLDYNDKFVLAAGLNNGFPALQHTLKTNWYDKNISGKYVWGGEYGNGDYSDEKDSVKDIYNDGDGRIISISKANDLAMLSFMTSTGYVTETVTNARLGGSYSAKREVVGIVTTITTKTYEYGVERIIEREVLNYDGMSIQFEADIDLAGKLFNPIGYANDFAGVTDINDNDVATKKDFNAFKGTVHGEGSKIKNLSVYNNQNAGLFGLVHVTSHSNQTLVNNAAMFNGLTLIGGIVMSDTKASTSISGAVAARMYVNHADIVYNVVANGLGNEKVTTIGGGYASGLIGVIYKNAPAGGNISNDKNRPTLVRAYSNASVKADVVSGLAYNENEGHPIGVAEVYTAGALSGTTNTYALSRSVAKLNVEKNGAYTTYKTLNESESTAGVGKDAGNDLQTKTLSDFRWAEPGSWARSESRNNNYPIFDSTLSHWFDYAVAVEESNNVYTITSAAQLAWISKNNDAKDGFEGKTIKLAIDLTGKESLAAHHWTPIGNSDKPFKGTFDGNGKKITNITSSGHFKRDGGTAELKKYDEYNNIGLFGVTDSATISNLNIHDSMFTGSSNTGALIGHAKNTNIKDVYATSSPVNAQNYVGGLVGSADGSNFTNVAVSGGPVTATGNYVGGLVGSLTGGSINNMHEEQGATFSVVSDIDITGNQYVGGIAGSSSGKIEFVNVRNSTITSNKNGDNKYVGGILGQSIVSAVTRFVKFEADSKVIAHMGGSNYVGGIIGSMEGDSRLNNAEFAGEAQFNLEELSGSIVGYSKNAPTAMIGTNTYKYVITMAVDSSSGSWNYVGSHKDTNYPTIGSKANVASSGSLNAYAGTQGAGISAKQFFEESSVWSGYELDLAYPGKIPFFYDYGKYYELEGSNHISYIKWLNNRDFTESVYNKYVVNTEEIGTTTYGLGTKTSPFVSDILGGGNTIKLNGGTAYPFIDYMGYPTGSTVSITNLTYNINTGGHNNTDRVGLSPFISVANNVELNNVTVDTGADITITGESAVGGVIGLGYNITLTDVSAGSSSNKFTISGDSDLGGIVGKATGKVSITTTSEISLYNTFASGKTNVGGVIGSTDAREITISGYMNKASITGGNSAIGGIVGKLKTNYSPGTNIIQNVKNNSSIGSTSGNAGGIIGHVEIVLGSSISITGSENYGNIYSSTNSNVGGIVGYVNGSGEGESIEFNTVKNFHTISSFSYAGGIVGKIEDVDKVIINSAQNLKDSEKSLEGAITVDRRYVGGIVGGIISAKEVAISNTKNTEIITSGTGAYFEGTKRGCAGGIVGQIDSGKIQIKVTHNAGEVIGKWVESQLSGATLESDNIGGIVGHLEATTSSIGDSVLNNNVTNSGAITGNQYVGGLVGYMKTDNSYISNTENTGLIDGYNYVGGLVGHMEQFGDLGNTLESYIKLVKNKGVVKGNSNVGGIVGCISGAKLSEIYDSENSGSVTAPKTGDNGKYVGGVVGSINANYSHIKDNTNNGAITGNQYVGGIVGYVAFGGGWESHISDVINTGTITASSDFGNIVGKIGQVDDNHYFWDIQSDVVRFKFKFEYGEYSYQGDESFTTNLYYSGLGGYPEDNDFVLEIKNSNGEWKTMGIITDYIKIIAGPYVNGIASVTFSVWADEDSEGNDQVSLSGGDYMITYSGTVSFTFSVVQV